MKKSIVMIIAMLAAGFVFAADPQGGKEANHHATFEEMDANKDGKVTLDEYKAAAPKDAPAEKVEARFKKIDANGDGVITKEEMDAATQKMKEHGGKHGDKAGGTK